MTGTTVFKGTDALFIENGCFKAVFTIHGAKLVSLIDKRSGRELMLQSKNEKLILGTYDSDYNAVDVCGFDEMFPTIDVCYSEQYPWEGVKMPDHGEVWSLDWDCASDSEKIEACIYGVRFPYKLSKSIYFNGNGALRCDYRLENLSAFNMEFLWAAHAMFAMESGSHIILPAGNTDATLTYSHAGLLGSGYGDKLELGSYFNLVTMDGETCKINFDLQSDKYMEKFYLDGAVSRGVCGVSYDSDGSTYMMKFPVEQVPYMGVLISRGLHIGECVILEPCTAAFDRPDRAKAFNCSSAVEARGVYQWYLEISRL